MASKTFKCRVVTPAASLADDEVVYASVPAWDGLLGVQVGRAPLLARLGVGELRLDYPEEKGAEGGSRWFALDGGFVRMADNQLIVLAERAVAAESFTLAEAEAELKSAATRISKRPTRSISAVIVSPGLTGPTPSGVPVKIRSPGERVMICDR